MFTLAHVQSDSSNCLAHIYSFLSLADCIDSGWATGQGPYVGLVSEVQWHLTRKKHAKSPPNWAAKSFSPCPSLPLSLGFLSTQSPMMAPSRSTEPATTSPYTAVSSRLFPYSSTRKTATAKFHIRSPWGIKVVMINIIIIIMTY